MYEYTLSGGTVDISYDVYDAASHPLYHLFANEDIENLGKIIGWEVDSNMQRLGYFCHANEYAIKKYDLGTYDKLLFLGIFYNADGSRLLRAISAYTGDEFTANNINYTSQDVAENSNTAYELRITEDVLKFITQAEINEIKSKIEGAKYFSHIKVRNNQLIKVYFLTDE